MKKQTEKKVKKTRKPMTVKTKVRAGGVPNG